MTSEQTYLSPPDVSEEEIEAVVRAMRSGWVAPAGPELTAFEDEIAGFTGSAACVALSSGTAALHLGLKYVGVKPGDSVICPTSTFAATAFSICHTGASPIFVDAQAATWNLDPEVLSEALADMAKRNELPAAIVTVDLFGRTCDYDAIIPLAQQYEIPLVIDAAEALGATYKGSPAGTQGVLGIYSFNGNKIITTSGGGALVSDDQDLVDKVRFWSTQAREDVAWYEHNEIGFNYRMSNILAALGRIQLKRLPSIIAKRKQINGWYQDAFSEVEGVEVVAEPGWGESNYWITNVLFDDPSGETAILVREALAQAEYESRPAWKPMHQQPVFADAQTYLNGTSDQIFARGLCLPSGNNLSREQIFDVVTVIRSTLG